MRPPTWRWAVCGVSDEMNGEVAGRRASRGEYPLLFCCENARLEVRNADMAIATRDGAIPDEQIERRYSEPYSEQSEQQAIPYPLASRATHPAKTMVRVGEALIGATQPVVIAGPCSVESEAQIFEAAQVAREAGAHLLRGGAFKPRTSPYDFQGLGLPGLRLLAEAGQAMRLPIVTEVMEPGLVEPVAEL